MEPQNAVVRVGVDAAALQVAGVDGAQRLQAHCLRLRRRLRRRFFFVFFVIGSSSTETSTAAAVAVAASALSFRLEGLLGLVEAAQPVDEELQPHGFDKRVAVLRREEDGELQATPGELDIEARPERVLEHARPFAPHLAALGDVPQRRAEGGVLRGLALLVLELHQNGPQAPRLRECVDGRAGVPDGKGHVLSANLEEEEKEGGVGRGREEEGKKREGGGGETRETAGKDRPT